MPIPLHRLGQSKGKPAANPETAPAPVPQMFDPVESNPSMPSWASTLDQQFQLKHPSEQKRFQELKRMFDDKASFFVSMPHGNEGANYVKGMLGTLDSALHSVKDPRDPNRSAKLNVHKPLDMDEGTHLAYRFGYPVTDLATMEHILIGTMPHDMIRLALFSATHGKNVLRAEFGPNEARLKLDKNERRSRGPGDVAGPGEKIISDAAAQARIVAALKQEIINWGNKNQVRFSDQPIDDNNAAFSPCPVTVGNTTNICKKYLNDSYAPLVGYARNIAFSALEHNRDEKIGELLAKREKGLGRADMPLDFNWDAVVGKTNGAKEAQELFFSGKASVDAAGKPNKEVLFLDLDTAVGAFGDDIFVDRSAGVISPNAREVLMRADQMRKRNKEDLEWRKVVIISSSSVKDFRNQETRTLPFVKYHELAKPDVNEITDSVLPDWLYENAIERKRQLTWGGKQIQPTDQQGNVTPDYMRLIKEMSRYVGGFTALGLREYLADCLQNATQQQPGELVSLSKPAINADVMIKYMRDNYVRKLFESDTSDAGAQVKDQFTVVDAKTVKPNGMQQPEKIEEYLRNVRKTTMLTSIIGSSMSMQDFKRNCEQLGITPADMGFYTSRTITNPEGQKQENPRLPKTMKDAEGKEVPFKTWDELDDSDIPLLKSRLANILHKKLGNFLLLHGPGGTGKTSTAAWLADELGFGFMIWNPCRSKNMFVGNTERNIELSFNFILNLRDYVVLIDEVDYCLGQAAAGNVGAGGHSTDQAVNQAFRTKWKLLEDAAPKNNLIVVSTTNYLNKMDEPTIRRLSGGASIGIDYLREMPDLQGVAGKIVDRFKEEYNYPVFSQVKEEFAQALYREASDPSKGPYSNAEIEQLFMAFLKFSEKVGAAGMEDKMYSPQVLEYIVQNSLRQSRDQRFEARLPSLEEVKSGIGQIPKEEEGLPGELMIPGFSQVPVPGKEAPPGKGIEPITVQQPSQKQPPKAKDVNLQQSQEDAEKYLVPQVKPKVPGKKASLDAKPGIRLLAIAETPHDQAMGLKHIRELAEDSGMLFKFQHPRVLSFWMAETYLPLDIAFIDGDGMIVKTERMVPLSLRSVTSGRPCVMALEVPAGTLEKIGATVGKKVIVDVKGNRVTFE